MWKNMLLKFRNPITLIVELLIPTVVLLGIYGLKASLGKTKNKENIPDYALPTYGLQELYDQPVCIGENLLWRCVLGKPFCAKTECQPKRIAIAPSSTDPVSVMYAKEMFLWLNGTVAFASPFQYFNSESEFGDVIGQSDYSKNPDWPVYSAAIIINAGYPNWDISLRFNQSYETKIGSKTSIYYMPDTKTKLDNLLNTADDSESQMRPYLDSYVDIGFFVLDDLVNSFTATVTCRISKQCTSSQQVASGVPGVVKFPNAAVKSLQFWSQVGGVFALLMILALLYPVFNVINVLVNEKETKIREGLMMMSARGDALWISWIFNF